MKRLFITFLVVLEAFALMGCGKKDGKESLRDGRRSRGRSEIVDRNNTVDSNGQRVSFEPTSGSTWGEIIGEPQDAFSEAVYALVSATVDPQEFGFVSGTPGSDTGIRFWGKVETNGSFQSGANDLKLSTAELRISIWDSFAGTDDGNGNLTPEYPIHFYRAVSGSLNGDRAVITFEDDYGSITLDGTISGSYFSGVVKFDNRRYWDDDSQLGAAGTLGNFYVSTCGFFVCN